MASIDGGAQQAQPGEGRPRGPITLDILRTAFHLPREQAAETLGLTVNELKKTLKQLGVARWPYRKLASLQSLHGDLEQQLQQFAASGDDPAIAAHIKDLKEMQTRIAEDITKITQEPNTPLDEGLHKLRLQNYKARFMGKHGLATSLPMLKMPAALATAASATEAAGSSSGPGGASHTAGGDPAGGPHEDGVDSGLHREGSGTGTGRRRRAASIAASDSIKRAAGLADDSDEDADLAQPASQRSKPSHGPRSYGPGGVPRGGSVPRNGLVMPHAHGFGPATLATLPSLPEGTVFQDPARFHSRLAQSAPLYDEGQGGALLAPPPPPPVQRTTSGVINLLNSGVASINIQQQQQQQQAAAHAQFIPGGPGGGGGGGAPQGGGDSVQFYSRQLGVPQHLLPQQGMWAQQQPQQQQHLQGSRFTSTPLMQFTGLPGQPASHQLISHSTDASAVTAFSAQAASQPSLMQGSLGPLQHNTTAGQPQLFNRHNHQSMPHLGGSAAAYGRPMNPNLLQAGPGPSAAPAMPVAEPLVTPLEELLDDMMGGSDILDFSSHLTSQQQAAAAVGAATTHQVSTGGPGFPSFQHLGPNSSSGFAVGRMQGVVSTGMLPGTGPSGAPALHSQQQLPSAAARATSSSLPMRAGPLVQDLAAAQQQQVQPPQAQQQAAPRHPNSAYFLLNSDDEDDAVLSSLLAEPGVSNTRLLGGTAHTLTHSAMDARSSMLLAQQAADIEAQQQQLAAQEHQLRAMQAQLREQSVRLQQQLHQAASWGAASAPALSTHSMGAGGGGQYNNPSGWQPQQQPQPNLHTISASPRPLGLGSASLMMHAPMGLQQQQQQQHGLSPQHHSMGGLHVKQEDGASGHLMAGDTKPDHAACWPSQQQQQQQQHVQQWGAHNPSLQPAQYVQQQQQQQQQQQGPSTQGTQFASSGQQQPAQSGQVQTQAQADTKPHAAAAQSQQDLKQEEQQLRPLSSLTGPQAHEGAAGHAAGDSILQPQVLEGMDLDLDKLW